MTGFTLTSSSSVATRDSSSKLGSPLAAPSVQHSSSKLGSAFGSRSHSSFFILHSSFFILHSSFKTAFAILRPNSSHFLNVSSLRL